MLIYLSIVCTLSGLLLELCSDFMREWRESKLFLAKSFDTSARLGVHGFGKYLISKVTPIILSCECFLTTDFFRKKEKSLGFEFIRKLLTLLLQHGLDPNVRFSQRANHILLSLMDMVQNARIPSDLNYVYDLTLTLIQVRNSTC